MSSLCDKLMCLGKRQELESLKSKLMGWLTDVSLIDFENVSMYQNNEDQDSVKYFLDWVDRNKVYATADEVVANIDANKQRLNLANVKLNEFKDMLMKIRELSLLASDDAHSAAQKDEFVHELKSIHAQIKNVVSELEFNGMRIFKDGFMVRDDLESGNQKIIDLTYEPMGVEFSASDIADAEIASKNGAFDARKAEQDVNMELLSKITAEIDRLEDMEKVRALTDAEKNELNKLKDEGARLELKKRDLAVAMDDLDRGRQELEVAKANYKDALFELSSNPGHSGAQSTVDDFETDMANLRGGLDLSYDGFSDRVDSHLEKVLEPMLNKVESCYKELCRTKANILRQKAQGYKNLESQRAQAKRHVEKKICNIMNQVAYLNVCISHNGH